MENVNTDFNAEMEAAPVDTATPVEATPANTEPKDERVWYNAEGQEVSKSAFIREQFTKGNLSRKEISEKFDIPYRTVYGATVNMENEAEPTSRGRGLTFSKIQVTADNKVVFVKDGIVYINNEAQPEGTPTPETTEVDRNTWIKDMIAAGANRGDVAKALDLSYGVVYGLTKEAEGTRQKYEVTLEDGTVISRSEYIRKLLAEGKSKSEIAKLLDVEYSVVWQATKQMKTVDEKFSEAVSALEKFMDVVVDPEALATIVKMLGEIKIKAEEQDKVAETGTESAQ